MTQTLERRDWPRRGRRDRLVAVLAACGRRRRPNPSPSAVPGATTGGKLTIGISFDQPGLGLKTGDTYSGFDVDTAKYVAEALGVPADEHHLDGGRPGDQRRAC